MADIRSVPPEMIYEIATGVKAPVDIAAEHGYDLAEFTELSTQRWFSRAIDEARTELENAGFTFERKMAMLAEDLMVKCYHAAKSTDVAITTKLEVAKQLAKLGRLEPAANPQAGAAGSGFAITINFKGAPPVHMHTAPTIDHQPVIDALPTANKIDDTFDLIDQYADETIDVFAVPAYAYMFELDSSLELPITENDNHATT